MCANKLIGGDRCPWTLRGVTNVLSASCVGIGYLMEEEVGSQRGVTGESTDEVIVRMKPLVLWLRDHVKPSVLAVSSPPSSPISFTGFEYRIGWLMLKLSLGTQKIETRDRRRLQGQGSICITVPLLLPVVRLATCGRLESVYSDCAQVTVNILHLYYQFYLMGHGVSSFEAGIRDYEVRLLEIEELSSNGVIVDDEDVEGLGE
ncbi:hypothetical protein EVAR_54784_1 [Eumeta japonica]|uniref:Uncharacterized protein n=1 Tax=Eumeta variegata TaxID=151549 RepID=A0A4C1YE25_EUMVA|nr:hypothetical protein EVAR_54784_1 [Eumeta japonica]